MSPEKDVFEAAEALVTAFGNHDTAAYFDCFSEDATFVFYNHPDRLESSAAYHEVWRGWESENGFRIHSCESTAGAVQLISPDVAVFTHEVATDLTLDGERSTNHERETIIFRHDADRWIAVHEHLSPRAAG